MDLNALLAPVIDFFSQGIGAFLADAFKAIYHLLFPANSDAATITPAE